jgi:alkyl hydroperoxide reductase subunit AhpF
MKPTIGHIGQTANLIKSNPKVEIMMNTKVTGIIGDNVVKGVKVMQNGKARQISVDGVFVNVGFITRTGFLEGILKLNDRKEVVTDKFNGTSIRGVFAAGDCTDIGEKQVLVSAGEGAKALIVASEYMAKLKK